MLLPAVMMHSACGPVRTDAAMQMLRVRVSCWDDIVWVGWPFSVRQVLMLVHLACSASVWW